MINLIKDLIREQLGHKLHGNFQLTATTNQLELIKDSMKSEWIKSGLFIIGSDTQFSESFSAISYEGNTIHFVEGDYFSIKELDIDYSANENGTWVYKGATKEDIKPLPTI